MKHRILAAIAAACLLPLAGCADLSAIGTGISAASGFTVTQGELDAAAAAYDTAFLVPAARYRQLGYCATGTSWSLTKPCADRTTVKKLQASNTAIRAEFATVQAMITSGNNSGVVAAFTALQSAITTAESLLTTFGVTTAVASVPAK